MRFSTFSVCAVVGLGVFAIGCDEANNTTPTPQVETKTAADKAADSAKSTADAVADKAGEVKDATVDAAGDLKDSVKDATNTAADSSVVAQAQKLYDDAVAAVNKADFTTAEKYFEQLKSYRDKLPADWQAKIDQLGTMITDAKAKLGNLPALPK